MKIRHHFFTLIELVAAMGILLLVAGIIGTASHVFYNAFRRSEKAAARLKLNLAIDQLMDNCVRNLIPFKWLDEDTSEERYVFNGENEELLFTALRRSSAGDKGALIFVRLRLEEDQLIAEYSFYPRLPWKEEEFGSEDLPLEREVLADNVQSVKFLYLERNSDNELEFYDEWLEEEHDALPLAIQLEIEWKDGRVERWLRRTAGSAANAHFGSRPTTKVSASTSGRSASGGSR